jgi:sugar lactone lactonase YvrE
MVLDPKTNQVFRGGTSLEPSAADVKPAADGLIHPTLPTKDGKPGTRPQGLSLNIDPANKNVASRGAYQVVSVPDGLQVIRDGTTGHFVIAPTRPMTAAAYKALCGQVKLAPTSTK